MTFRHEDRMEYQYITAGKDAHLLAVLAFLVGIGALAAAFTVDPRAMLIAAVAIPVAVIAKIVSAIQRWYWRRW